MILVRVIGGVGRGGRDDKPGWCHMSRIKIRIRIRCVMGRGSLLGQCLGGITGGSLSTEIEILGKDMNGKVSEVGCGEL